MAWNWQTVRLSHCGRSGGSWPAGTPAAGGAEPPRAVVGIGTTPFGHGEPFSRSQLAALLKEARFSVTHWDQALLLPPLNRPAIIAASRPFERISIGPWGVCGVIIVEAVKQVYAFSSGKRARRMMPRFRPVLLPQPRPANRLTRQSTK